MAYVMCYAAAVPNENKDAYTEHATRAAEAFKAHGATRIVECWGREVPPGELTSFPAAVKANENETVVVGWQEWPDKATCDAGMPKAMEALRAEKVAEMPFDGKRLIFAGFDVVVDR